MVSIDDTKAPQGRRSAVLRKGLLAALACSCAGLGAAGSAQAVVPGGLGRIAFESNRAGSFDIWTMNGDGTQQKQVTNNPADDEDPAFSPDGSKILFASDRTGNFELYTVNPDGTGTTQITHDGTRDYRPSWSPDGSKIAFVQDQAHSKEIVVANADGSNEVTLTNNRSFDGRPEYSPDGSQIAFISNRTGDLEVWVMNSDGSNQHQVTFDGVQENDPNWSPDGTKIYFAAHDGANIDVYSIHPDGTGIQRLTNDPAIDNNPAPSRDGSRIYFTSTRTGNPEIFVMFANGSGQTDISNNPAADQDPDAGPANGAFSCGASALRLNVLGIKLNPASIADQSPCPTGVKSTIPLVLPNLLKAGVLTVSSKQDPAILMGTAGDGQGAIASSSVANAVLLNQIALVAAQSSAIVQCHGGVPVLGGSSSVSGLRIGSAPATPILPNTLTVINAGGLKIVANEKVQTANSITVRALHITGPGIDIALGESTADFTGQPCG